VVWTSAAQARATLGSRYFDQYKENFRLVRKYAERAISIDASFSDAHRVLGLVNLLYDFNWNKARQEFNLALQLDPNNSDAYRNLGQLEGLVGSFETELEAKKKSIDLNPLSSINISNLALAYSTQMRFDEAEQILTESLDIRSNLGSQLMEVYLQSNKVEKAQKLFEQVYANADSTDREFARALTSYASGKKSEALVNLRKTLKYYRGGSFRVAEAFAFMDQKEEAFHWLSKAFDEKFRMQNLKRSLPLRKLHDDPRYEALLKKMNLPLD
jgi:tetratricopeptide (TPR) repeat protein